MTVEIQEIIDEPIKNSRAKIDTNFTNLKTSADLADSHRASTSNPHAVTKTQLGLGNVDNTSDANKPVSTATQTQLDRIDDSQHNEYNTGFGAWTSGVDANVFTVDGTGFQIDRAGYGYIHGVKVTWVAGQKTAPLTANLTSYIYIDSNGTIGVTTSVTDNTYKDNIVLFECLYDGTNYVTVKENHPYSFDTQSSRYLHNNVGTIIRGAGAIITRVASGTGAVAGDREVAIVGNDVLEDHGLETTILDSAGAGRTFNTYYKNGAGKWVRSHSQTQIPMQYNNAGTPTAITTNRFGVFVLYVSKSDPESADAKYFAVMNNAEFTSSVLASQAISNGTFQTVDNELAALEFAQLGYCIVQNNASGGYIYSLIVSKSTLNRQFIGGSIGADHGTLSGLADPDHVESSLSLSDNLTNNVNTARHGFCPKAPNDTTKFLRGDGTWASASVVAALDDLTDVTLTTPASGDALKYNGSAWVNEPVSGASIIQNEPMTGTVDGVNTVFTTAHDFVNTKIAVYVNTVRKYLTEHFTVTGPNEITFLTAPTSGGGTINIIADYVRSDTVLVGDTSYEAPLETPAGLVNGSNTVFTTSEPYIAGTLKVYLQGQRQIPPINYSETTSTTFTMAAGSIPQTDDSIRCEYQTALTPAGNADTLDGLHLTDILGDTTEKALNTQCKCRAYLGTNQLNLTDLAYVKVNLDTESYDIGSDFDTTNKRFVAPVSGYYQVNAGIYFNGVTPDKRVQTHIYVNGASYTNGMATNGSATGINCNVSDVVYCAAGQYIELYARAISGDNLTDIEAGVWTYMSIHLLSV